MKKKLIALLVAVALTIGAIPAYAFATAGEEAGTLAAGTEALAGAPAADAQESDILAWWETLTQEQKLDFVPNLPEDDFEEWMYRLGELGLKDSHPAIDGPIEEFRAWWERLSDDKRLSIAGLATEDEDWQAWGNLVNTLLGEPVVNMEDRVTLADFTAGWPSAWNGSWIPIQENNKVHVWLCADYGGPTSTFANENGGPQRPFTNYGAAVVKGQEIMQQSNGRIDTLVIWIVPGNYLYQNNSSFLLDGYSINYPSTGVVAPFWPHASAGATHYGTFDTHNAIIDGGGMTITALTPKTSGVDDDWIRSGNGYTATVRNITLQGVRKDGSRPSEAEGNGSIGRAKDGGTLILENVTIENFRNENRNYTISSPIIAEGSGTVIMTNCTIRNNHFSGGQTDKARAGAISALGRGSITLTDTVIENNTGEGLAGAIYMGPNSGRLTLENCVIRNNTSRWAGNNAGSNAGAAVYLDNATSMELKRGVYIYNNKWYNNAWQQRNVFMNYESNLQNNKGILISWVLGNVTAGGNNLASKVGVDIKTDTSNPRWGNKAGQWVAYAVTADHAKDVVDKDILVSDRNTEHQTPTEAQQAAFLYATQSQRNIYWGQHEYDYYVSGSHANRTTDINDKNAGQRDKPFADLRSALQSIAVRTQDRREEVVIKVLDNAPYAQGVSDGWNASAGFGGRNLTKITIQRDENVTQATKINVTSTNQKMFENVGVPLVIQNLVFDGNNQSTGTFFKGTNDLTLINVTVQNFKQAGNRIYFIEAKTTAANPQKITVNNCTFQNNQFSFALFHGNAQITMTGGFIKGNTAGPSDASLIDVTGTNAQLILDNVVVENNGSTPSNPLIWIEGNRNAILVLRNGTKVINNNKTAGATAAAIQADGNSTVNLNGDITISGNQRGSEEKNLEVRGESVLNLTGNVTGSVGVYDNFGSPTGPSFNKKFGNSNGYTAQNSDNSEVFYTDIKSQKETFTAQVVDNDLKWLTVFEYYVGAAPTTATGPLGTRTNPYGSLYAALNNIKNDESNYVVNIYVMDSTTSYFPAGQTVGWTAGSDANTARIRNINIQPASGVTAPVSISVGAGSDYLFSGWGKPLSIRNVNFTGSGSNVRAPGFYRGTAGGSLNLHSLTISDIHTVYSLIESSTAVTLTRSTFTGNNCLNDQNPMIEITNGGRVTLTESTVKSNNSANLRSKGMIQVENGGTITLQETHITDNTVGAKGAIYTTVTGTASQPIIFDIVHDSAYIKSVKGTVHRNNYRNAAGGWEQRNVNIGDPTNKLIQVSGQMDFNFYVGISYDHNPDNSLRSDQDIKEQEFGITTVGSQRYVGFHYDLGGTRATARERSQGNGANTVYSLYWECPDIRYVAELVTRLGEVMKHDNGDLMRYTTVSEALAQVGNVTDRETREKAYIVRLIDQSQYWGITITNWNDLAIREAYVDFRDVGNLDETDGIVYLDLNGQVLVTQGLVIPSNVKMTGLDSSGKLKNSKTEGAPKGELRVSNETIPQSRDKHAGIYEMDPGQDPSKVDSNGRIRFSRAKNNGLDLSLDNFYPYYVGQCMPLMISYQTTLAPAGPPTAPQVRYGWTYPTINDGATEKYDKLIGQNINSVTGVGSMVSTVYTFARFRMEPVKHRIVMEQESDSITLGTLMMFQTNSQRLLDIRWAFGEAIQAPQNEDGTAGESKGTYQYTPAKDYGSKDELGWVGPHFTYYVETKFKIGDGTGNETLKNALALGKPYQLINKVHFPVAGFHHPGTISTTIVGRDLAQLVTADNTFSQIAGELLPQVLQNKNSNITINREYGETYVGLLGVAGVSTGLGYACTPDKFLVNGVPLKNSEIDKSGSNFTDKYWEWQRFARDFAYTLQNDGIVGSYYTMTTHDEKDLRGILEERYKAGTQAEQIKIQQFLEKMQLTIKNGGITQLG